MAESDTVNIMVDALSQARITNKTGWKSKHRGPGHEDARDMLLETLWKFKDIKLLTSRELAPADNYAWNDETQQWHIWPEGREDSTNMYEGNFKRPDLIYHDKKNDILIVVKVGVYWWWNKRTTARGKIIDDHLTYLLDKDIKLHRIEWEKYRPRSRDEDWKVIGCRTDKSIMTRKYREARDYASLVEDVFEEERRFNKVIYLTVLCDFDMDSNAVNGFLCKSPSFKGRQKTFYKTAK